MVFDGYFSIYLFCNGHCIIGVNFLAYLTSIRMEKAKKLLLATSLSIGEISEKCGYADYRVFTKAFKKEEGSTPSQYRRNFL